MDGKANPLTDRKVVFAWLQWSPQQQLLDVVWCSVVVAAVVMLVLVLVVLHAVVLVAVIIVVAFVVYL